MVTTCCNHSYWNDHVDIVSYDRSSTLRAGSAGAGPTGEQVRVREAGGDAVRNGDG